MKESEKGASGSGTTGEERFLLLQEEQADTRDVPKR